MTSDSRSPCSGAAVMAPGDGVCRKCSGFGACSRDIAISVIGVT